MRSYDRPLALKDRSYNYSRLPVNINVQRACSWRRLLLRVASDKNSSRLVNFQIIDLELHRRIFKYVYSRFKKKEIDFLNPNDRTVPLMGKRYFVSFIDDCSKIAKVYRIKTKYEVFDCLVQYINESGNST